MTADSPRPPRLARSTHRRRDGQHQRRSAGRRGGRRADRSVLVADHQTAGTGRLDRRWDAPPGANLLVSLLFRDVPEHPHELTQRVALAAVARVPRGRRCRRRCSSGRTICCSTGASSPACSPRPAAAGRRTSWSASGSTSAGRPRARPGSATASTRRDVLDALLRRLRRAAGRHRATGYRAALGHARAVGARRAAGRRSRSAGRSTSARRPARGARRLRHHPPLRHGRRRPPALSGDLGAGHARRRPPLPSGCARARRRSDGRADAGLPSLLAMTALVRRPRRHRDVDRGAQDDRLGRARARTSPPASARRHPAIENFLLVGSDSRAGDRSDGARHRRHRHRSRRLRSPQRHHHDPAARRSTGDASLLSIPRDLWVQIAGHDSKRRINSAFNDGPEVLVQTLQSQLGLPIHHYVEIDFAGFKRSSTRWAACRSVSTTPPATSTPG